MVKANGFHKVIIGRAEPLFFVGRHDQAVPAKVDSGAYHSAVHATDIVEKDGQLSFNLLNQHPSCKGVSIPVTTDKFKVVVVSNSFGDDEKRYEVNLRVKLGPKVFNSPFTLTNRAKKVFPILLGRKLLNDRFIIDSSTATVSRAKLKKQGDLKTTTDGGK